MHALIIVMLVFGCLTLMLWAVDWSTRAGLASEAEAEARSMDLLLQNLTPEQKAQYAAYGFFDVVGSTGKGRYRIHHGTSRNVYALDEFGASTAGRCFTPRGVLPAGDCMLAQKIALENCEDDVLRVALRF